MNGHGEGRPTSATLAPLEAVAEDIRTMRVRGAGRIARAASSALSNLARDHPGPKGSLLEDLRLGARILAGTRPTAVSLRNAILLTLSGARSEMDLGSLRAHVTESSSVFVASSLSAVRRIADHGLPLIREGSVVMTHCNSDAALTLIERAFSVGRVTGVVATESRPWRQGHVTSVRLASHGVPVTLIVDPAANLMMEDAGAVIVGADTVASDGSLVNKIGTSLLALAAKENEVPFIVCAETFKFSIWARTGHDVVIEDRGPDEVADPLRTSDLPGVLFRNPVFDVTPPGNITRIVTEEGPISPRDVTGTVERLKRSLGLEVGHGGRSEHWLEDGPFIEEG